MNILLIDTPESSITLMRFLQSRGFCVTTTPKGEKGLILLQTNHVDLVICDLHLPDISGLDVLQSVQNRCPSLPVIITTGDRDLDNAISAFRNGAHDYFKKPINLQDLQHCLNRLESTFGRDYHEISQ